MKRLLWSVFLCFSVSAHSPRASLEGFFAPPEILRLEGLSDVQAKSLVRAGLRRFLDNALELMGYDSLFARLKDVASSQPFGKDRRIRLFFVESMHPHNLTPGHPYPALVVGVVRAPGIDDQEMSIRVIEHELWHLVLGKFNDGMTEPMANLYSPRRAERIGELELQAYALLELRQRDPSFLPEFSLKQLMSYQPNSLLEICRHYRGQLAIDPSQAEAKTRKWVEARADQAVELLKKEAKVMPTAVLVPNPNETPGAARHALYFMGTALLNHLLSPPNRPASLFSFYYEPTEKELHRRYGVSYSTLESRLWLKLKGRFAALSTAPLKSRWEGFLQELQQFSCYRRSQWHTQRCTASSLGSGVNPDFYPPSLRRHFTEASLRKLVLGSVDHSAFFQHHPSVGPLPIPQSLGRDWDLPKLCSPKRTSQGS